MRTQTAIHSDMTVANVVEMWPAAMPVLAKHGVDLCCGGSKTLAFASRAHGFDLQTLLAELEEAVRAG